MFGNQKNTPIWQKRFWEYTIRNDEDYENHMNYIHYNPVKHVHEWKWSTFHYYVHKGWLNKKWESEIDIKAFDLKAAGE